jgi:hypothetical protein
MSLNLHWWLNGVQAQEGAGEQEWGPTTWVLGITHHLCLFRLCSRYPLDYQGETQTPMVAPVIKWNLTWLLPSLLRDHCHLAWGPAISFHSVWQYTQLGELPWPLHTDVTHCCRSQGHTRTLAYVLQSWAPHRSVCPTDCTQAPCWLRNQQVLQLYFIALEELQRRKACKTEIRSEQTLKFLFFYIMPCLAWNDHKAAFLAT